MINTAARRDFDLPEEDVEHLNARGVPWETVCANGAQWRLLHEFRIPPGDTVTKVDGGDPDYAKLSRCSVGHGLLLPRG